MKHKYTIDYTDYTWKGLIFGTVLLGCCIGIVLSALAIIIKHFLFFQWNQDIVSVIGGGLTGVLIVLSFKIAKWYWNWVNRVMVKFFDFFSSNGSKQEG